MQCNMRDTERNLVDRAQERLCPILAELYDLCTHPSGWWQDEEETANLTLSIHHFVYHMHKPFGSDSDQMSNDWYFLFHTSRVFYWLKDGWNSINSQQGRKAFKDIETRRWSIFGFQKRMGQTVRLMAEEEWLFEGWWKVNYLLSKLR